MKKNLFCAFCALLWLNSWLIAVKYSGHEEVTGWNWNHRDGVCPHDADPGLS